jgi:hypothetical protein
MTLAARSLSHLSWEPRICKHSQHFDDPWQDHYTAHDRKGSWKPLLVYDIQTGQIIDWKNREKFAHANVLSCSTISNSISLKRICLGRYILGNTIDGLFKAMAKNGYQ